MIVTLTMEKINNPSNGYCCTFSKEMLENLSTSGVKRRRKIFYKLYVNNRELQLECPMLKNAYHKNIVIWPAIKLPYRKYPVYVYLYAAALYLSSNLSMRSVAAKVRNIFGLDKFSHSTLSRTLKKLSGIVEDLFRVMAADIPAYNDIPCKETLVPRRSWDTSQQEKYRKLLHILFPMLDKVQTVEYGSLLNYKYFNNTMKFVI